MDFRDVWTSAMSPRLLLDEDIGLWNWGSKLPLNDETSSGVVRAEEKITREPFTWGLRVFDRESLWMKRGRIGAQHAMAMAERSQRKR